MIKPRYIYPIWQTARHSNKRITEHRVQTSGLSTYHTQAADLNTRNLYYIR